MSAPVSEPTAEQQPQGDPVQQPSADPTPAPTSDEALREPGKRALEAERAARAKAEAELASIRKQIDDAKKSAEQRAADDLRAAQEAAARADARALRYEIAAEKGIPLNLAARLTGSTRDEILQDADVFKGLLPATATVPAGPVNPTPDPGQGARPGATKSEDDLIFEAIYPQN